MRRIAVINQKGGVGKTTTTANLGAALARSGSRVLLVDFDPQGHLTLHFGAEVADGQASIYDVLTSSTPVGEVAVEVCERLTLVPADIDLAGAETELVSVTGREVLLREAIDVVADSYDYMLIDCPPSLGVLTINALVASNEVLIPLQAHFFALQGLGKLLDTVTLVRRRINPDIKVAGVILCMHDATTRLSCEVVDDLTCFLESSRSTESAWASAPVFRTRIRRNIKLAEASGFGQSVFDYAPRSNGAIDYANLADEIFASPSQSTSAPRAEQPSIDLNPQPAASAPKLGPTNCDQPVASNAVATAPAESGATETAQSPAAPAGASARPACSA